MMRVTMIAATISLVAGWIVSFELWSKDKTDSKLCYIPIILFSVSLILDMISIIITHIV